MSRRAAAPLWLFAALVSAPLAAQPITAEQATVAARAAFGPPAPEKKRCAPVADDGEIVVCAEEQEQSQFRIRSDDQAEDDYARETMDKGAPRAPDVAGPGIFKGPATVSGICGIGLNKCPPPPAYFIDFAALPETPPGSDAERVGQGLAPTGDAGASAAAPVNPPGSASPAEPPSGSASPRAAPAPG